jgi:predicted DNA-binding protein (UPF0251 family)
MMPYQRVAVDRRRIRKSNSEIERLYFDEGLTFQQVGDRLGITRQAVQDRLRRGGLKGRPRTARLLDLQTLVRLYLTEHLSQAEIAASLGVGRKALERELTRHGIERRKGGKRKHIDRDLLERLYVTDGLTQVEAAAKLGVGVPVLLRNLRDHEISFRHKAHKQKPRPKRFEYDLLYDLYVEQRKSCVRIGEELGASGDVILYWLKRNGIPRRRTGPFRPLSSLVGERRFEPY